MAKKDADAAKKSKKGAAKKGGAAAKKGKKGSPEQPGEGTMTIASHPKASASVRRAKGWGGVGGFAIAAYLSSKAGVPPDEIGERALGVGVAGYLLAWGCSVSVWRHLVVAELRAEMRKRHPELFAGSDGDAASTAVAEGAGK
jgi:hypothetical protein